MSAVTKIIFLLCLTINFVKADEAVLHEKLLLESFGNKLAYYKVDDQQKDFQHAVDFKKRVSGVLLSQNKKFALVKTDKDSRSEFFGVDVNSRKILFRSPEYSRVIGYYWMDNCNFAIVQNDKDHGGTVQTNNIPANVLSAFNTKCEKLDISLDKVPANESPKLIFKMDEANLWAYFSNGSREVVFWLSDGLTFDFVEGKKGQYFFREANNPSKIYVTEYSSQKFSEFYNGDGTFKVDDKGRVVLLDTKQILQIIVDGKSKKLLEEKVVSFVLEADGSALLARLENGQYRYLKL